MIRSLFLILSVLLLVFSCNDNKKGLAISKIKGASKLATTKTTLNKMIFATQDKKFMGIIKFNQSRFAAQTKAYVLAGVDLSKLEDTDVRITENTITLKLPAVEVLDFAYPFSEYKIDHNITIESFANKITLEDHEALYRKSESEIRALLPYMGIKEATETKTRQLLESLLRALGYSEIYISFKPGKFIQEVSLSDEDLQ